MKLSQKGHPSKYLVILISALLYGEVKLSNTHICSTAEYLLTY